MQDDDTLCIITEVCYGGDLEQLLRERGYLTEAEAARVVHAAARVLEECHRSGICYGDVKPANFLLKWPFPSISDPQALPDIRVADFGCAQELGPVSVHMPLSSLSQYSHVVQCSALHQVVSRRYQQPLAMHSVRLDAFWISGNKRGSLLKGIMKMLPD